MSPSPPALLSDTELLQIMRQVLLEEAQALQAMAQRQSPDLVGAVRALYGLTGRLVVSGIGKSAIIAQKLVATFNSTGTPALFLHAADALHGDLGMVRPTDGALLLSKSGETPEMQALLPLLRREGVPIWVMVGNMGSTLARAADYVLDTTVTREADPLNLAPTTSSTASLALGDALAIALLQLRGFSANDFARYHPGGSLGKRLYLTVGDLLAGREGIPAVPPQASLPEVVLHITRGRMGAVLVLEGDRMVGIITDGDLRRMLEQLTDPRQLAAVTAQRLANPSPKTLPADRMATEALEIMERHSISQLVVTDGAGRPQGLVHWHDLLREGLR